MTALAAEPITTPGAHGAQPAPTADLGRDLITITSRPDTVFAEGHGSYLVDENGRRYLALHDVLRIRLLQR